MSWRGNCFWWWKIAEPRLNSRHKRIELYNVNLPASTPLKRWKKKNDFYTDLKEKKMFKIGLNFQYYLVVINNKKLKKLEFKGMKIKVNWEAFYFLKKYKILFLNIKEEE